MSFRKPRNPKELRTALHTFYEPYAQGYANTPVARLAPGKEPEAIDALPEITQPIARALVSAWQRIDEDRVAHRALIGDVIEAEDPLAKLTASDGTIGNGMVVSRIGRNMLYETVLTPVPQKALIVATTSIIGPRAQTEDYIANASVQLADGRVITGGGLNYQQLPDAIIKAETPSGASVGFWHFDARDRLTA